MKKKNYPLLWIFLGLAILTSLHSIFVKFFTNPNTLLDYASGVSPGLFGTIVSYLVTINVLISLVVLYKIYGGSYPKINKFFAIFYPSWYILWLVAVPVIIVWVSGDFDLGIQRVQAVSNFDILFTFFNFGYASYLFYRNWKDK